ncbi:hypothetical protein EGR_11295 [Echinococcus granulosus]|uniref:Uncharacterized protein n=1 Tax=Echinococcus granulosus TaxID=6210 RepID=W6UK21_ECHGR|nr:hypothetical protein EGR_11295 [Echinococcus granulosus]EUB53854.1 hypothetical protein EGR_11295 [Echinococcus granulosus]
MIFIAIANSAATTVAKVVGTPNRPTSILLPSYIMYQAQKATIRYFKSLILVEFPSMQTSSVKSTQLCPWSSGKYSLALLKVNGHSQGHQYDLLSQAKSDPNRAAKRCFKPQMQV